MILPTWVWILLAIVLVLVILVLLGHHPSASAGLLAPLPLLRKDRLYRV